MRREFDKSLKVVARPALEKLGYIFDGKRKFVRKFDDEIELVIEYQLGLRGMAGEFTVNLIVGDMIERLGMVKPTLLLNFSNKVFGWNEEPWWMSLFLPKDKWWKISSFQKEMDSIMRKTTKALEIYGVPWLENYNNPK